MMQKNKALILRSIGASQLGWSLWKKFPETMRIWPVVSFDWAVFIFSFAQITTSFAQATIHVVENDNPEIFLGLSTLDQALHKLDPNGHPNRSAGFWQSHLALRGSEFVPKVANSAPSGPEYLVPRAEFARVILNPSTVVGDTLHTQAQRGRIRTTSRLPQMGFVAASGVLPKPQPKRFDLGAMLTEMTTIRKVEIQGQVIDLVEIPGQVINLSGGQPVVPRLEILANPQLEWPIFSADFYALVHQVFPFVEMSSSMSGTAHDIRRAVIIAPRMSFIAQASMLWWLRQLGWNWTQTEHLSTPDYKGMVALHFESHNPANPGIVQNVRYDSFAGDYDRIEALAGELQEDLLARVPTDLPKTGQGKRFQPQAIGATGSAESKDGKPRAGKSVQCFALTGK